MIEDTLCSVSGPHAPHLGNKTASQYLGFSSHAPFFSLDGEHLPAVLAKPCWLGSARPMSPRAMNPFQQNVSIIV